MSFCGDPGCCQFLAIKVFDVPCDDRNCNHTGESPCSNRGCGDVAILGMSLREQSFVLAISPNQRLTGRTIHQGTHAVQHTAVNTEVARDITHRSGANRDLVEAYAWLQLATQSDVPEVLRIEVLAKLERLEARLPPRRS